MPALGLSLIVLDGTIAGISLPSASQSMEATRRSAGSAIDTLRAQGTDGPLGTAAPAAVSALDDGFAGATRTSLFAASGFPALGLLAALQIPRTLIGMRSDQSS
ncbi:hypothetical protein ACFW96_29235 [Streptomyces gardneri]|uniref:hypothetical protein n=1 Tax=Streptomyces gardneri TaxID=66892 RepID=UPI003687C1F3